MPKNIYRIITIIFTSQFLFSSTQAASSFLIDPAPKAVLSTSVTSSGTTNTRSNISVTLGTNGNTDIIEETLYVSLLVTDDPNFITNVETANVTLFNEIKTFVFETVTSTGTLTYYNVPILYSGSNYYSCFVTTSDFSQANYCGGQNPDFLEINFTADYTPIYRFWSDTYNGHFYTGTHSEKKEVVDNFNNEVWYFEGVGYYAYPTNYCEGKDEVYRFWSSTYDHHFYTTDEAERDGLIANDPNWAYEGLVFCAQKNASFGTSPVYRFWSENYKAHFYTISESEKINIENNDPNWSYEGIAYYAII